MQLKDRSARPLLVQEVHGRPEVDARPRQFTDLPCFLLFATTVAAMTYMYSDARRHGDIRRLLHGIDWMGRVCGVDANVTNKPMLYWCVTEGLAATDGICVETCPTFPVKTSHLCPGKAHQGQRITPLRDGDYRVDVTLERSVARVTDSPTTEAFGMYCLPTSADSLAFVATRSPQLNSEVTHAIVAMEGIYRNRYFLLFIGLAATALSFGLLCLVAIFIEALVYAILCSFLLLLIGASVFFGLAAAHLELNPFGPYGTEQDAQISAVVASGTFGVLSLALCASLCCLRTAFATSFSAIREAMATLKDLPTLVLAPFAQVLVKATVLGMLALGLATVASLAKVTSPPLMEPNDAGITISGIGRSLHFQAWQLRWVMFWVIGSVWVMETVAGLGQYALAHAVVLDRLDRDRVNKCAPLTVGFLNGAIFHIGTCAFGGFIIGVISVVATACSFLAKHMRRSDGRLNWTARAACCCCTCCLEFLEIITHLTNELAYANTAVFGTSFPGSSRHVWHLLTEFPDRFATAKWVATLIKHVCIFTITFGGASATYLLVRDHEVDVLELLHSTNVLGTTAAAGIICFALSSSFMATFDMLVSIHVYCTVLLAEEKYMFAGIDTADQHEQDYHQMGDP